MALLECEVAVIGAGMAGASIAAHLAQHTAVRLLEMEDHPGYHSTGRSAAQFSETYGNKSIRALSRASRQFLFAPPPGFAISPLVKLRGNLTFGKAGQIELLDAYENSLEPGYGVQRLSAARTLELCPLLRADDLSGGVFEPHSADIDVHALHLGYLKLFKSRGGTVTTASQVINLERRSDAWWITTSTTTLRADIVVNAAGAWAGEVGKMAGAFDIGLQPRRRTAALIEPPAGIDSRAWPMVGDVEETFYIKPDAGLLLLSPADETPVPPGDVQPEDLDVAVAIDRLEQATGIEVRRVVRTWAGLRSFVADRAPCVGFDPQQPGFFWHAALGGYGIQTAPALSELAAALVLDRDVEERLATIGLAAQALSPSRLDAAITPSDG
jgi:D-arginine dehydrogenase